MAPTFNQEDMWMFRCVVSEAMIEANRRGLRIPEDVMLQRVMRAAGSGLADRRSYARQLYFRPITGQAGSPKCHAKLSRFPDP